MSHTGIDSRENGGHGASSPVLRLSASSAGDDLGCSAFPAWPTAEGSLFAVLERVFLARYDEPDPLARTKALYLCGVWLLGIVMCTALAAAGISLGAPLAAVLSAGLAASGVLLLGWLRRSGDVRFFAHATFAVVLAAVAALALSERPLPLDVLCVFAVIPVQAVSFHGARTGRWWLVATFVTCASVVLLSLSGVALPYAAAGIREIALVRIAIFLLVIYALGMLHETLMRRLVAAAHAASRWKSVFLANASHELRTPMAGVVGLVEVVASETSCAATRERLGVVQRTAATMIEVLDELLDQSRIESGAPKTVDGRFSPAEVAGDTAALFEQLARAKGLELRLELGAGTPARLRGDGHRIRQVLSNLVGNAVKFTSEGFVTVRTARDGADIVFEVEDTGIGIPDAAAETIFARFDQGDARIPGRFGGTGLGLAIARELCHTVGGRIELRPRHGGGSIFRAVFPALVPARPSEPAPAGDRLDGLSLLVVDDNAVNLMVAEGLLRALGASVTVRSDAPSALALLSEGRVFDAILLDCFMPDMDGFEAARRVRAMPLPAASLPVIAVTASVMAEDVEACLRAGMDAHVPKPIDRKVLATTVRATIEATRNRS